MQVKYGCSHEMASCRHLESFLVKNLNIIFRRIPTCDWRGPLGEFFNRELYRTVQLTIREQLLRSKEKQLQGGLVFKARRLLYHSTLGRE